MLDRLELHRARLASGLDLDRIHVLTALRAGVIRAIDEGRFESLPAGVYARAYVRAFATAVGADGERAVAALAPILPCPADPLPALREHAPPSRIEEFRAFLRSQRFVPLPANPGWLRRTGAAAVDAGILVLIGAITTWLTALACGVSIDRLLEQDRGGLATVLGVAVLLYFAGVDRLTGRTAGTLLLDHSSPTRIVVRLTGLSAGHRHRTEERAAVS